MALNLEAIRTFVFQALAPTIRRVNLMISRGVIRRVNDYDKGTQELQVSMLGDPTEGDEEVAEEVEHLQPFGVSFVPPANAEVAVLSVGGNRDHVVALGASSREHRPRRVERIFDGEGIPINLDHVRAGEGGLYTLTGWKIFLDSEGNVFIGADEGNGAIHKIALASKVEGQLSRFKSAIENAAVTANDGGAAFKANIIAALTGPPTFPEPVGSSKVKAVE